MNHTSKLKYINPDVFKNNDDFYVPSEIISVLYIKNPPEKYKVVKLKIGKIRRAVDGKITTLYDTINYQFLMNQKDEELRNKYEEYCTDIKNTHDNPKRSISTFKEIEDGIANSDYDIHKGAIIVNQYNFIQDGLHRSCVLLKKYGPDYKIDVLKIHKRTQRRMILISPLFEIREFVRKFMQKRESQIRG